MSRSNLPPNSDQEPRAGYERRDVSVRAIAAFGFGLAVLGLVVHFVLLWTFDRFQVREQRDRPEVSPVVRDERPPLPRLQRTPTRDLEEFRAAEAKQLTSYGWIDSSNNTVRIPIDRAIDLLIERGWSAVESEPLAEPKVEEPAGPANQDQGKAPEGSV